MQEERLLDTMLAQLKTVPWVATWKIIGIHSFKFEESAMSSPKDPIQHQSDKYVGIPQARCIILTGRSVSKMLSLQHHSPKSFHQVHFDAFQPIL